MQDNDRREPCGVEYAHGAHRTLVSATDGLCWQRCPGVRPEVGERFTVPAIRRIAVEALRSMSSDAHHLISRWTVDGKVYDDGQHTRPRKLTEYPENSVAAWDNLITDLARVEREARELRAWAERRRNETEHARDSWRAVLSRRAAQRIDS